MPSDSPLSLVREVVLSVVSADAPSSVASFATLPLAGARFPFLGVTGSGPSVSPSVSPFSVLMIISAAFFFFGEARFFLGQGVSGSAASPFVVVVAFLTGERFLAGWVDSSLVVAAALRFLGVFGAASVFSLVVSLFA